MIVFCPFLEAPRAAEHVAVRLRVPSTLRLCRASVFARSAGAPRGGGWPTSCMPRRPFLAAPVSLKLVDVTVVHHRSGRRSVPAVVGVTLEVDRGRIVGLVGESGSGKSSLGKAAVGLIRPTSGRVIFDGQSVHAIGALARPRSQLGLQMVFQNPFDSLNPRRKIGGQLMDGLAATRVSRPTRRQIITGCWTGLACRRTRQPNILINSAAAKSNVWQ